jgi:hypothetical protein
LCERYLPSSFIPFALRARTFFEGSLCASLPAQRLCQTTNKFSVLKYMRIMQISDALGADVLAIHAHSTWLTGQKMPIDLCCTKLGLTASFKQ